MVWRLTKSGNLRSAGKGGGLSCKAHHLPAAPRASRYSTQSGCPMEADSCKESPLVVLVDGLDVQVPGVNQIGQDVPAAVARNVCRRVSGRPREARAPSRVQILSSSTNQHSRRGPRSAVTAIGSGPAGTPRDPPPGP